MSFDWKIRRIVVVVLSVVLVLMLGVVFSLNKANLVDEEKKHSALPLMEMVMDGVSLKNINEGLKGDRYEIKELRLISDDALLFEGVDLEGRGNATWNMPKKPYKIAFNGGVSLLNLGKAKKWNLLANYSDDSELRNDLALKMAQLVGIKYVELGDFVRLTINDEDLGLYYLTKSIRLAKYSVDLKDENALLVEFDNAYCLQEENYYITGDGNCLVAKDARNDDRIDASFSEFIETFEKFEENARMRNYEGVVAVMDVDDLAKYYLISDFVGNGDAFFTSMFMYKNGADDKIHLGPAWDFDGAFGNIRWWKNEEAILPESRMVRRQLYFPDWNEDDVDVETVKNEESGITKTMYYLGDIPEFQELVSEVYKEALMGQRGKVMKYISQRAEYIRDAALVDAERWEKGDFDEAVKYLKWWVEQRFDFMDSIYGDKVLFKGKTVKV